MAMADPKGYSKMVDRQNKAVENIDYVGISYDVDVNIGGGGGYTISAGYVKGDGIIANIAPKTGIGGDVSASLSFEIGFHNEKTSNEKPSGENIQGLSSYESGSFFVFTASSSQDISKEEKTGKATIGHNWNFFSIGITIGSSNIIQGGGTVGVEYTSPPVYLYKEEETEKEEDIK